MIKKIFAFIVVAIAGFFAVAAMQPDDFLITRSASINAPAAKVFPLVNNLRNWDAWSPWAKLDPNAKNSFEGPAEGAGAVLAWSGDHNVGEGRMTIVESKPEELVRFRLEFVKPFAATNSSEFIFRSAENQTQVTWSMSGKNNLLGKAIGLVMNCEKMVGGQFEQGLAQMKSVAEHRS